VSMMTTFTAIPMMITTMECLPAPVGSHCLR